MILGVRIVALSNQTSAYSTKTGCEFGDQSTRNFLRESIFLPNGFQLAAKCAVQSS